MDIFNNQESKGQSANGVNNNKTEGSQNNASGEKQAQLISSDLQSNLDMLHTRLGKSPDIVIRRLGDPADGMNRNSQQFALVYVDGLVNGASVNELIAELSKQTERDMNKLQNGEKFYQFLKNHALAAGGVTETDQEDKVLLSIFNGNVVVLVDGCATSLLADMAGGNLRSVEEPSSQTVIRGPKDGFTESLRTNTSLIRRKIKSPDLRIDAKVIGTQTKTNIAVVYLKGVAKEEIVQEIHRRLDSIQIDGVLEGAYIEEFIQDAKITVFPTMINTERPDAASAGILEGQVVIIVDGSPFVLLMPVTFFKFFQSSEDYYQRYDISTFLRMIRYVSFLVSMLLPSLYIAITTFHQEMLPTTLLIGLAAQRDGVPFPALLEALLMEMTFEVLREAGVRMPRVIGPAISIVGALVLGQAAVQAGLVSGAMVIVVSFTAIANFVIPAINMAIAARLTRFLLMLLGATLGLFGIISGLMFLLIHMASLRSFGFPYMAPLAPLSYNSLKDIFIRVPWWKMNTRPEAATDNIARQENAGQSNPSDHPSNS
ncbi:spore germination protein [Paenibacillus terrigena]|uniref:spore germination protein n=1 Tax=Paenibacillus terrigena TaxID=369333 RepID=UPI00035EFB92|nr:spore germination protein [Paenibacillus terrigena]